MPALPSAAPLGNKQMTLKVMPSQSYLPFDIVAEILSALPVKSLVRFRCVCRQWNSLTCDPFFINMHIKRARTKLYFTPKSTLSDKIKMYNFSEDSTSIIHIAFRKVSMFDISNFVDGLTCAYRYKYGCFYLLNPFNRELAKLPRSNNDGSLQSDDSFGFGCDVTTGEYKLVRLFSGDKLKRYSCEILTLGAQQQWRYLGKTPGRVLSRYPVYLHGTLCWKGSNNSVLAFDIRKEKFGIIQGPPSSQVRSWFDTNLRDLGGHLCLIHGTCSSNPQLSIWMMKDSASCEWTELDNIDASICLKSHKCWLRVIGREDEKLLIILHDFGEQRNRKTILSYDTNKKSFRKLCEEEFFDYSMFSCSESLISPGRLIGNAHPL